jgi:hypothetical protein
MPDEEKQWYELVKHNLGPTDETSSDQVLTTVRGLARAQGMVDVLTDRVPPEERDAGISVYLREGKKPAGFKRRPKPPDRRKPKR